MHRTTYLMVMGLFSSDVDEDIKELVENAERGRTPRFSDSLNMKKRGAVTPAKLTELVKGFKLTEQPLIDYLEDGEQPEYIFRSSGSVGPAVKAHLGDETAGIVHSDKSAVCITDERILIVGREDGEDISLSFSYDEISSIEWDKLAKVNPMGRKNHTITIFADAVAVFGMAFGLGKEEVKDIIGDYQGEIAIDIGLPNKYDNREIKAPVEYLKSKVDSQTGGSYKSKVFNYLDEGEELEIVLKGKTGEIIQGDETKSQYGGSGVYTAITDRRVFILVGQRVLGDDIRNISYDSIDGVDLETGVVLNYVNIHSGGRTYKMHVFSKDSAKRGINYIRKKSDVYPTQKDKDEENTTLDDNPSNSEMSVEKESEKDPKMRLEELNDLLNEGLISEGDFRQKKKEILEEL